MILRNGIRLALKNIPKAVVACAVLHNIAQRLNQFNDDEFEEEMLLIQEERDFPPQQAQQALIWANFKISGKSLSSPPVQNSNRIRGLY